MTGRANFWRCDRVQELLKCTKYRRDPGTPPSRDGAIQRDQARRRQNDAFFLADLQRLNILPTGYIYDPALRPVRDLLRRRLGLVRQRTALMLSFQTLYARTTGSAMSLARLKSIEPEEAGELYQHPANNLIAQLQKEHIDKLTQSIELIEKRVLNFARQLPYYNKLLGLPGVGRILGMTISMEVGEISRFKSAGHFASYCRTVDAKRISNNKKKRRKQSQVRQPLSGLGLCRSG